MAKQAGRRILATWGNSDFGRLGYGAGSAETVPRAVTALSEHSLTAVTCGSAHTAAIGDDGSVYTMGLNDAGQLGHSHDLPSVNEPCEMLLPEATTAVAAGSQHTLMLAESGDLWAVGNNRRGQLGLGKGSSSISHWPHRIPALVGTKVIQIAAGLEHSLAVTEGGELLSWGAGSHAQLGHGKAAVPLDRDEPGPRLIASLQNEQVMSAAAGFLHSGCVTASGKVYMWGSNDFWQLGIQQRGKVSDPQRVDLRGVEELALSGHHTLALRHTGELLSWGANENGVLGFGKGSWTAVRQPTLIPDFKFSQIACGWKHCAAIQGGELYCWGWGGSQGGSSSLLPMASSGGQLGLGNDFDFWSPTRVESLLLGAQSLERKGNWRALKVACGLNHTAAIIDLTN